MSLRARWIVTTAVGACLSWAGFAGEASAEGARRFTTADAITMRSFGDGQFSPDGRYYLQMVSRGRLPEGVSEAAILLYETAAIRASIADPALPVPQPVVLAKMTAAINGGHADEGAMVMQLRWSEDGRQIAFLGRNGRENRQLFTVDIGTRKLRALTPVTQDVVNYHWVKGSFVYLAAPDVREDVAWWTNDPAYPDIERGTGRSYIELLYPNYWFRSARWMPTTFELWRVTGSKAEPVIDRATGHPVSFTGNLLANLVALSPDGRRIITVAQADHVPKAWERYERGADWARTFVADPAILPENARLDDARALQYEIFDLATGKRQPLIEAPATDYNRGWDGGLLASWSPDGRRVAVAENYMPLTSTADAPTKPCAVAVVEIGSAPTCLASHADPATAPPYEIDWSKDGKELTSVGASRTMFVHNAGGWSARGSAVAAATPSAPLNISFPQDQNKPPVLLATDPATGKSRVLLDPNPQLADVVLGEITPYSWADKHGRAITGALLKPPGFKPGHRYGLVIQTHGGASGGFYTVGYSQTASAGRALAGRDLLVLQVREPTSGGWFGTPDEAVENGMSVYLAAIDKLAGEGLIDPKRVGLSGYSRTGLFVATSLTREPTRFAAAVIANTDPGTLSGYQEYIDYLDPAFAKGAADLVAGSRPYGDGLKEWLNRAPGFQTDRVRTPILFSAADPHHLLSEWGFYAPLRDQGRPVELQFMRSGAHNLVKPLQILAHQEAIVDWFDFWLNDHEDPTPAKAAQYQHWRVLRMARDEAASKPIPPLLKWTATPVPEGQ